MPIESPYHKLEKRGDSNHATVTSSRGFTLKHQKSPLKVLENRPKLNLGELNPEFKKEAETQIASKTSVSFALPDYLNQDVS